MVRNDFWRSHKEGPSNYFHKQIPICLHKSSLESLEFQPKEQLIYKSQVQMTLISRVLLGGKSIHFTSKPNQQKKTHHLGLITLFPKKTPTVCFVQQSNLGITIISISTSHFHIELQDLQGIFQPRCFVGTD